MMQQIIFDLDVTPKNINIGTIKRNNVNTIQLVMNVVYKGKPVDLTGVTQAVIAIKRPDGTVSNSWAVVDGSEVRYLIEMNAISQNGVHQAELQLFGSVGTPPPPMEPMMLGELSEPYLPLLMITSTFYYNVQDAIYDDEGITEQADYPILVKLIADVQAQMALIMDYLNRKFLAIKSLNFFTNGFTAQYVDDSIKEWAFTVDDKGHINQLLNETDNKVVNIAWHNTER